MKTLLFLLLFTTVTVAKNLSYLLPHQHDSALSQLSHALRNAHSSVTIISTKIDSYELKKAFMSLVTKKIPVTIFTYSDHHLGVEWVQYANVSLFLIDAETVMPLTFSLIMIDDAITCKLSTALDASLMQSTFALFECSSTKYARKHAQNIRDALLPYSQPYLKEAF